MKQPVLFLLGGLSLIVYGLAWWVRDLRAHTAVFLCLYFVAFLLYTGATILALRQETFSRQALLVVFGLAIFMHTILVFTPPTLSDDMYRYVWNGRIQAAGFSPYQYPPNAPELTPLRDDEIWPQINRKSAVTVYPPAAETTYALLWRIWPDSVRWFQITMSAGALLAGLLLVGLLQDLNRSPARVLIYLWAPLLAFETAHAAHVDGLVLPLLVGAWWARVRRRDGLLGLLIGLATAIKFYPALLLSALWRPRHPQGRWQMPAAFGATVALLYLPYLVRSGVGVVGYLPIYFQERFNMGLAALVIPRLQALGLDPDRGILALLLLALLAISLYFVIRPAADGETAVRRCIWPIGAFTLLTQNLFAWYMLWLLPLLAIYVQAAPTPPTPRSLIDNILRYLPRLDAWTGWWLFCGLVALSYTFFISWRPVTWAIWAQFLPLYLFLAVNLFTRWRFNRSSD